MSSESQNSDHSDEESEVEEEASYDSDDDQDSLLQSPTYDSVAPPSPVHKRPRVVNRPDRLSALPESLILHILSFLPILDSIRTGLLSRKWQYLWTCLPTLTFNYAHMKKDFNLFEPVQTSHLVNFVHLVNKTLVLCDGSVKNFTVNFPYRKQFASNVNLWSRFASKNGVEKLELDFNEDERYVLPQFLYRGSKFRELRFWHCRIEPKHTVDWNSLKKLSLGYVDLSDDVIQMIVAGTPVLEMLELYDFKGITKLHMVDSRVKRLVLRGSWINRDNSTSYDYDELFPLEIWAPNVQTLEVSGCFQKFELVAVKSLVEASLSDIKLDDSDTDEVMANQALALFDSLAHVKTLTLGTSFMKGLARLYMEHLSPPLLKCNCLTIDTELWKLHPLGIAFLLDFFPFMETLTISEFLCRDRWCNEELFRNLEDRISVFPVPLCDYKFLRTVELFDYWAWDERETTLEFVEFLLKNARMLRKMTIHTGTITHSNRRDPNELFRFAQKLLSFERSSPHAQILICDE